MIAVTGLRPLSIFLFVVKSIIVHQGKNLDWTMTDESFNSWNETKFVLFWLAKTWRSH